MSFDRPAVPLRSMCSFAPKLAPSSMMYWSEARKRLSISRSNVAINDPGAKLDPSRSSLVVANPSPSLSPPSPTAPSTVTVATTPSSPSAPSLRMRLTEAKMNSTDSLNGDSSASQRSRSPIASGPGSELHQPGADLETPRGGSSVASSISSPSSVRRADPLNVLPMGAPPQHLHGHGFPVPNQMLLDPSTGQHYIVPSQPQYIYQPVYLNPSPHAGPIYYQAASPAGPFLVTASRPSPAAFMMAPSPAPSVTNFGSSFNEALLRQRHSTSSGEVPADEKSEPDSGYFTRGHDSRISTESSKSADVLIARQRSRQSPPSPSSISLNSNVNAPTTTSFATLNQGAPQSPKKMQPTPMYGTQPSWWGRSESEERLDEEAVRRASPRQMVAQSSPPPAPIKESHRESPPPASRPQLKPVRMDIDFNRPVTPELKQEAKPRVTSATAFTVSFDEETPKKVTPKTLQDAARQSTKSRQMLRRSAQPKEAVIPENSAIEHDDPKRYLLSKMLQGNGSGSELITVAGGSLSTQKRDVDALSDAGTYVVDEKDAFHLKLPMKQLDSDDDTATTVSSASGSSSPKPRTPQGVFLPCTSTTDLAPQRRSIGADARAITAARPSRKTDLPLPRPTVSTAPARPVPSSAGPANSNFRQCRCHSETRGDGGRYSMSVGKKGGQVSPGVGQIRPPFKAGLSSRPQSAASQSKDSAEMQGWLRRKEYNPMKSAAEGQKKMQQLKARLLDLAEGKRRNESDNFTSSRSISFHHGSTPSYSGATFNNDVKGKDMVNPRFLSKDDSIQNMQDVEKAVDELTAKCNKSIQLIRSNQGLSDSVENLLKRAVDPVAPVQAPETIGNRLERLSSTFDAIQKFLEEQQHSSSPSRPLQRPFAGAYRSRFAQQQARSPSASRGFPRN
ncbi:hypothetical protein QR680_004538 [Steinernema hermaphroditum]|uniref:Uncharacterized protein n=1 Tax=Steinernema hermaphroditum TaxID=289476 RepID=A0AA39HP15_9BILA|nr:hypothetical protein QR680_004538 [Steinernema hermaphroditum]